MASHEFYLVSNWHLKAPLADVWAVLSRPEEWPNWWRAVKRVEVVSNGDASGLGAVREFTWRTALPYTLSFRMTATRVEPMQVLEGQAKGELDGVGRWTLGKSNGGTNVKYEWIVTLRKPWQRAMAPVLRPVFTWNHNVVLGWGYDDIRRKLGTP